MICCANNSPDTHSCALLSHASFLLKIAHQHFQPALCQDAVYYEHYRGAGFKMIMKTFAAGYSELVDGKKLGDPKLRRYHCTHCTHCTHCIVCTYSQI
jgi:hypothetical protein